MRGKSSTKKAIIMCEQGEMMEEFDNKVDKLKVEQHQQQQPHLSGAYIRSLVKQLTTSSRTKKDPSIIPKPHHQDSVAETQQSHQPRPPQPPPPHKKQVRRRLHTTRPYQERLLNMAEARREIVTALKFHRAAMKQAGEQQQRHHQQHSQVQNVLPPSSSSDDGRFARPKYRRSKKAHHDESTHHTNDFSSCYLPAAYPPCNPYTWSSSVSSPVAPLVQDNLSNLALPNQTLGLNLNLQDFSNLDNTTIYNTTICNNNPSVNQPISSFPSASSYYSSGNFPSNNSLATIYENQGAKSKSMVAHNFSELHQQGDDIRMVSHPTMDVNDIAEIRSIGEQHQMELNDTLNLVSSAWWLKFLKSMESTTTCSAADDDPKATVPEDDYFGGGGGGGGGGGCSGYPFDEIMEFPAWLNANESSSLQQRLQDYYSDDYLKDTALPCMDIQEIEAMDDGDWLA